VTEKRKVGRPRVYELDSRKTVSVRLSKEVIDRLHADGARGINARVEGILRDALIGKRKRKTKPKPRDD
jgi:uncharacterized protein (DUF4415 family)